MLFRSRDKISQILRNLLSNAVKFTEHGEITVKAVPCEISEGGVTFTVSDTGIGIPQKQLSGLFVEFKQGDGSISRKYGGTGLGLSISKKLAALMGGEIAAESEPGVGSVFSLHLKRVLYPHIEINDAEQYVAAATETQEPDINHLNTEDRKVVLIIADNQELIRYLDIAVNEMGLAAIAADTVKKGLLLATKHRIDGVLLSSHLPDMTGIEALREIKFTAELKNIPVYVISTQCADELTGKAVHGRIEGEIGRASCRERV